jgi:hypothetical protein
MNTKDIETIIGFPVQDLDGITKFYVFANFGDETESLGETDSIEEALEAIRSTVFQGEEPDLEDEVLDKWPVKNPAWGPLAYMLSEEELMGRITDETKLYYLQEVLENEPDLRLVVAWEAIPHLQDVAFGIFAPRET